MDAVEAYFQSLSEIRRTGGGSAEESYYGALETLLNAVGSELKPRVRAVGQLRNLGAGEPDFGLFAARQFQRAQDGAPPPDAVPERGVVEAKGWDEDAFATAAGTQVARYCQRYGLVLATNYRDFVLVGRGPQGGPETLESLRLGRDAAEFQSLIASPGRAAREHGHRLAEFLRRVLLYEASLANPEDLAWFLASYAREARHRVEAAADLPALEALKQALEEALGMRFEGGRGDHFFRATLVQTLFYGVFSSWVLWSRDHWGRTEARFDWRNAAWTLHVPMVASLFDQIATPTRLKPLGVDEVLDWAGAALNRVDRPEFFRRFEEEHAVQYFYEPFLRAYDPELRKDLGVWYTPPEIVRYQVERVDRVLREELGLADGLADEQVVVLDPCCGTGAYLVETLRRIHDTLEGHGHGALAAQRLKRAAMNRVFGFEIMPAPFVVAHLQLGLTLRRFGAPLDHGANQRVGVYLTNALTGWDPPGEAKAQLMFPELMAERDAANRVKTDAPILVVLGNPPYNAFAGTSPEEEGGLVDPYKEGLTAPAAKGGWGIKKFNLDDLYVRFFRIAERRIAKTGKGVVSFISNYSYISDPSFVVMRRHLLGEFDKLWIDCMHGDSRATGKLTPEGKPDPSVFSTERSPVGIRVGTAVCMLVRAPDRARRPAVRYRDFWGASKRADLLDSLRRKRFDAQYKVAKPAAANRFSFRPLSDPGAYAQWPRAVDLCGIPPSNGLMEKRGGALIDADREALARRMRAYLDARLDWDAYAALEYGMEQPRAGIVPRKVREAALAAETFDSSRLVRYAVRPFDVIWAYYSPVPGVWNRARPSYHEQCWEGNAFFMTRPSGVAEPEGFPVCACTVLGDNDFQRGHAYFFPIRLRRNGYSAAPSRCGTTDLFVREDPDPEIAANLSEPARAYLAALKVHTPDADAETAGLVWMHALAVGYSPAYLAENADAIRQDWPRFPMPAAKQRLLASAALGRRVAALLDVDTNVPGVTSGKPEPHLRPIGTVAKVGGGSADPGAGDLDVSVGWGRAGREGVCMPGPGRITVRPRDASAAWHPAWGVEAVDVWLNDAVHWANVPRPVWEFTVGGYQVVKKWLSYRERAILGRGLTLEEAAHVTSVFRRVAALVAMQPDLDANYAAIKADTWPWPGQVGS